MRFSEFEGKSSYAVKVTKVDKHSRYSKRRSLMLELLNCLTRFFHVSAGYYDLNSNAVSL